MNPANYLRNNENKDGGNVGLANNHSDELRYSCVRQVGGKSNLANSQAKPKRAAGGYDDLANKLLKSERVKDRNEMNDIDDTHKNIVKSKGPKLRPIVGAHKASSRPTSHILSRVIKKVSEIIGRNINTNCESTEEMIAEIEKVNEDMKENEDVVIGSLDVIKWYPSMELKRLIEVIME